MLLFDGVAGVVALLVWVFCVFEAITADPARVRNLPKWAWVVLVVVLVDVGSFLWLVAGRPRGARPAAEPTRGIPPEYDRPGRATAANPDDDAAFLAQLKARAEEQRAKAQEDARRADPGSDG